MRKRWYAPSDCVPGDVSDVEDQILGFIVFRSAEDFRPVFEVGPCFFRSATTERRKACQKFKEDTAERPIVD
jgi:hypothetical protein